MTEPVASATTPLYVVHPGDPLHDRDTVLSLWSGSRALNVFVDTITIMYGLAGKRGIIWTRALSFLLFVLGLVTGVVALPLVLAGPDLVTRWVPPRLEWLAQLYWPIVLVLCICFLATLYHVSVPVRTNWSFNLPGATFSFTLHSSPPATPSGVRTGGPG